VSVDIVNDRELLIAALENGIRTYQAKNPRPTALGSDPDNTVIDPLAAAISGCVSFARVAEFVVYTGGGAALLLAPLLPSPPGRRGFLLTKNAQDDPFDLCDFPRESENGHRARRY
jgi:hypothetical protein